MLKKLLRVKTFFILIIFEIALAESNERVNVHHSLHLRESEERISTEQLLIERLFKNYNKKSRPNGTVQIKFALNLNQIVNLNQKDQIIVLNAFIDHEWIDDRLAWDPAMFDNISIIRVSGDQLWTPDTFIYTTADHTGFLLPQSGAQFVIKNNGVIFWPNPLTQMRVRCRMGIIWFPFDEQLCVLVFGSWSFTCNYLNYSLMSEYPSLDDYTENNEWTLIGFKPNRSEIIYANWIDNYAFSEIRYKILIRRKPLFVLQNCVIPAIMLCILTLVSFFIPFASEMQIGISIMLAFSVFKLRLSDDVPVQSDSVPLINIYFTLCMSYSLTAMIWFSSMNLLRQCKQVPKCFRYIVERYICFLMCIKVTKNMNESPVRGCQNSISLDCKPNPASKQHSNNSKSSFNNNDYNLSLSSSGNGHDYRRENLKLLAANANLVNSQNHYSKISSYYKKINRSHNQNLNTNQVQSSNETHSKKKKKSSKSTRTHSDSEFEDELERLKEKRKFISRDDDDYNNEYYEQRANMVWLPQSKSENSDRNLVKPTFRYWEKSADGNLYFPIKINYDHRNINLSDVFTPQTAKSTSPTSARIISSNSFNANIYSNGISNGNFANTNHRETAKNLVVNQLNGARNDSKVTSCVVNTPASEVSNETTTSNQLSDSRIIKILNEFVFLLFLTFIILLNLIGLVILPYFIKQPMSIDN